MRASARGARGSPAAIVAEPVRGRVDLAEHDVGLAGGEQLRGSPPSLRSTGRRAARRRSRPSRHACGQRHPEGVVDALGEPGGDGQPGGRVRAGAGRKVAAIPAAPSSASATQDGAPADRRRRPLHAAHPAVRAVRGRAVGVGSLSVTESARSYTIRTYGCQMNVHDSERMAGLLEAAGYAKAADTATTPTSSCSTPARSGRTPTTSSTATSASCGRPRPRGPACRSRSAAASPQKDRDTIVERAPWVDVVFGTHNVGVAAGAAGAGPAQRERRGGDPRVPGGLPVHAAGPAGVGVRGLGVDLRGLQQHVHVLHRPVAAGHREGPPPRRRARRGRGTRRRRRAGGDAARPERQLLRRRVRRPRGLREAAARVRRRSTGLERVRFTSPHPATSPPT